MKAIFAILLITGVWFSTTSSFVYDALKGDSLEKIESALINLEADKESSLNNAYKGALLMKKAGFQSSPSKKVKVFKQGHQLLEAEIKVYPDNTEYRFLRLAVQVNAAKILKYNKNIDEDRAEIIANYESLNRELKKHGDPGAMEGKVCRRTHALTRRKTR